MSELSGDNLLNMLDLGQRAEIERIAAFQVFSANHIFFSPGEQAEQVFLLRQGRVRLYKLSHEGRALTLSFIEPVALFGEAPLEGPWFHDSFAEAIGEVTVGVIPRSALRNLLERSPALAIAFMTVLGRRLRLMENRLADIAFKSVPARLATVLLTLAGVGSQPTPLPINPQPIRFTHQQLAEMIGSYRETVTKTMGDFRELAVIRIDDDAILLVDVPALQRLALR